MKFYYDHATHWSRTAHVRDLVEAGAERSAWQAHEALKLVRMLLHRVLDEELI